MKVLHIVNISFVIPYFLGEQLLYFQEKGYKEFIICSPSEELFSFSQTYHFDYREVEISRKFSIIKDLKAIYLATRFIKQNQIDVVVGHTPKGALIAMIASYIMKIPTRIYFRHGLVYETSTGLKRNILISIDRLTSKLASKIVCVSPSVCKKSIEDNLNTVSKQVLLSKGTCNGININKFCRTNINTEKLNILKQKLGIGKTDFVIGFTGRLVKDKGIIDLTDAFKKLQKKHTNIILLLVGMLEERDSLPSHIVNIIKQNSSIINTGYIENSLIEYYYALMNVFALPSYREGFPTSVLEASSMELPIITTRETGCIDSILENQTGVFVEHSSSSIENAIELFYDNKDLCTNYGKKGRIFIENNFSQHIIWNEIEKLYKS